MAFNKKPDAMRRAVRLAREFTKLYPVGQDERAKLLLARWPEGRGRKMKKGS